MTHEGVEGFPPTISISKTPLLQPTKTRVMQTEEHVIQQISVVLFEQNLSLEDRNAFLDEDYQIKLVTEIAKSPRKR